MCGIAGWVDWHREISGSLPALENMVKTLVPRGPDSGGVWMSEHCALGHRRLSVIDPANGAQPMSRTVAGRDYTIVYNGELYNTDGLRRELQDRGYAFRTRCDTEVLLLAYIEWGAGCLERLVGIFAFAIWDEKKQTLFLARDRLGVKPLFYALWRKKLIFGSEPKAIFAYPGFTAEVDRKGFAEIFAIGPARTPGHGVFKHLAELKPGHFAEYDRAGLRVAQYWKLDSRPHQDDENETIRRVFSLLEEVTESQLVSDVPVCFLLSGGLDSSALTAIANKKYRETGICELHTFSVDYAGNDRHFRANAFQPDADAPWIRTVSGFLGTKHHIVELTTPEVVDSLAAVVLARDLPGMADIDGSLLLFCRRIKEQATVAISGEGADEIFGGYPWFYREDALQADTFPWSLQLDNRMALLSGEAIDWIRPREYVDEKYREALSEVPRLPGENAEQAKRRELAYLSITRFMPTLLDRKDRMSMAAGLEVRVPFCDHRLVEYVWNLPWDLKTYGSREKGILRAAMAGLLPHDVLYRKKSPYPKTFDPQYAAAVQSLVLDMLDDPGSPILPYINRERARTLARSDLTGLQLPWFGQLMSGPQLLAYLYQINFWMKHYRIS